MATSGSFLKPGRFTGLLRSMLGSFRTKSTSVESPREGPAAVVKDGADNADSLKPVTDGDNGKAAESLWESAAVAAEPAGPGDAEAASMSSIETAEDRKEKLTALLHEHGIPTSEATIDLVKLGTSGPQLQERVLSVLTELRPQRWSHIKDPAEVKVERISGAMTNCVFSVSGPADESTPSARAPKILLRVYGTGVEQFIKRDREMFWLCQMSQSGVAPTLLGAFSNGRFEQYLDSVTLTKEEIRDPETSRKIASALYQLHILVNSSPPEQKGKPELWRKLRSWHRIASNALENMREKRPEHYARIVAAVDLSSMAKEIEVLGKTLKSLNSPIVFSHNDLQYGNVLRKEKDGTIVIVDYEYSGINYRGYDIANHFCEWAADYHCDTPHLMNPARYPSKEEQINFLSAYLDAQVAAEPNTTANREEELESIYKEVNKFTLCSNLLWGLWGVMQAEQSEIDFDFVGYALERFNWYKSSKESLLAL